MVRRWLLGIALCGAFVAYVFVQAGLFALAFVVAGTAVMFIVHRVKDTAGRTIGREVQRAGPIVGAVAVPARAVPGRVSDGGHPLSLEVVEVGSLPTLSAESRTRFDAIRARGVSLRRLYRRVVLLLALAITGLTFVASWISE